MTASWAAAPSFGGGDGSPLGSIALFALVVGVALLFSMLSRTRERSRRQEFLTRATENGWYEPGPADALPASVAAAKDSDRSQLLLTTRRDGENIWISWHRWTERKDSSAYNSSAGRSETDTRTTTHDLTRCFVRAGGHPEPISLERRTKVGGLFIPVRGEGTGDASFDRAFLVHPKEGAPIHLLTQDIRDEMLAGLIPLWQIDETGMLVTRYDEAPGADTLEQHADALLHVLDLLPR
ncbi:hypothetical protein GCM10022226_38190 [Sphaerisporangium flaviroseum]|uniref:Uncharacterized protein n=1 Tax=Sphaerisporangium flaviroseum TaxID=509199 RepID=A0ABP7IAS6_9ACTN